MPTGGEARFGGGMDAKTVRDYFDAAAVVDHYTTAAEQLGLWLSEEKILTRVFQPSDSLLELGCGAGRIALGLYELGYRHILATDYSRAMLRAAQALASRLEYRIAMRVSDATQLEFEDNIFDGVIFGFNGLMQIPQTANRAQALQEIFRVLRPGGWFVFTTHDRERSPHQRFWIQEQRRWQQNTQQPELDDFGDRSEATRDGAHFMHVPAVAEVEAILLRVGFHLEASVMRSEIAHESAAVMEFSDDCRFWVVQKPARSATR